MLSILLCATIVSGNPDGTIPDPKAEEINAFFLGGITPDKGRSSRERSTAKYGINRVYNVADIEKKFGKAAVTNRDLPKSPKMVKSVTASNHSLVQGEIWTWECGDGSVEVTFAVAGYGTQGKVETKRLQVITVKRGPPTKK